MSEEFTCLACRQTLRRKFIESVGEFTMYQCPNCGLQFSDPMSYSAEDYDSSYSGNGDALVKSYAVSMETNRSLIERGDYFGGHDSKQTVFQYVKSSFHKDSPILDLGCGAGNFLAALDDAGFEHVMGMDIAKEPIELLSQDGFDVAQGTLDDYPEEWPVPRVVLMIEVLEHLPNPVETLTDIRTRFPDATLVITVPSPHRVMLKYGPSIGDRPPNHLTRWTEHALSETLRFAGYDASVQSNLVRGEMLKLPLEQSVFSRLMHLRDGHAPQPHQQRQNGRKQARIQPKRSLLSPVARLIAKYHSKRGLRDYRLVKNVLLYPLAWRYRRIGYTGRSLIAVGTPSADFDPESSLPNSG